MAEQDEAGFESWVDVGVTLEVADVERSLAFYRDGLGFEVLRDEEDPENRLATLRRGNTLIDLVPGNGAKTDRDHQGFRLFWVVEDFRSALNVLIGSGGRIIRHMEYGILCRDPDGYAILMIQKEPDPEDTSY